MVAGDDGAGDDGGACVAVGGGIGDAGAATLHPTRVTKTKALMARTEVFNDMCCCLAMVGQRPTLLRLFYYGMKQVQVQGGGDG